MKATAEVLVSDSERDPIVTDYLNQFDWRKQIGVVPQDTEIEQRNGEPPGLNRSSSVMNSPINDDKGIRVLHKIKRDVEERGIALQKWEGIVTDIQDDIFIARLFDKTNDNIEEEAEILINDLHDDDLKLLKPGAVFYLSLGYIIKSTGQKIRGPIIKFRRIPAWTNKELNAIKMRAKERRTFIEWGSEDTSSTE